MSGLTLISTNPSGDVDQALLLFTVLVLVASFVVTALVWRRVNNTTRVLLTLMTAGLGILGMGIFVDNLIIQSLGLFISSLGSIPLAILFVLNKEIKRKKEESSGQ